MLNDELFRFNCSEFWLFRLVKPVGWAIFTTAMICLIVFMVLFSVNFAKFQQFDTFEFTNPSSQYEQLALEYNQHFGNLVDTVNIYFMGFMISAFICVLTRLNTRIWSIFRTSNQYISEAYAYYMDKKKLIITLFFFLLLIVFNTLLFVSVWYVFAWFKPFIDNINNANEVTYKILTETATITNANILVQNFIQVVKNNLLQINADSLIKSCGTFILLGIIAAIAWVITNIIYGFIVLFYKPKYLESNETQWLYLNKVDEKEIKSKMLPVGKKMSFYEYKNWSTNGYGDNHQLMRDRQYETYIKRSEKK